MASASGCAAEDGAAVAAVQDPMDLRRNLFSSMVGEHFRPSKSACRIANDIEEDLIAHGWVVGGIRGSEMALARQFGVCREVVREAARILEARGTARMRRGPNGGLLVQRPEEHNILGIAIRYARLLGCSPEQTADARRLLAWVRCGLGDNGPIIGTLAAQAETVRVAFAEIVDFFEIILDAAEAALAPAAGQDPIRAQLRSRATHVAHRIMEDHNGADWHDGCKLGAEFDLCERYSVDRSVLRQAIRILESEGAVISQAGRGHGLVLTRPGPGAICRLAQCYFASCGLGAFQVFALFGYLSAAAVALAAERAMDSDKSAMARAVAVLEQAATPEELHEAIFDVEESQFAILSNPLVNLFLRSTRAFPCWNISRRQEQQPDKAAYLSLTLKVMAAIGRNDAAAAAAAQYEKFRALQPMDSR